MFGCHVKRNILLRKFIADNFGNAYSKILLISLFLFLTSTRYYFKYLSSKSENKLYNCLLMILQNESHLFSYVGVSLMSVNFLILRK